MSKVSIVIPTYNGLDLVISCVDSIIRYTPMSDIKYEIIIADDGSTDRTSRVVGIKYKNSPLRVVRSEENRGFAKTVNMGIKEAKHDLILLLNNDVTIEKIDWLKILVDAMEGYDMAAPAAGKMSKTWEYEPGEATNNTQVREGAKRYKRFYYPVGWCLMVRRNVFDTIGLIPEDFGKGFFDDVLFGKRASDAGMKWQIAEGMKYDMKVKGERRLHHQYHATFKREGYSLGLEYSNKRKIFLKIING